MMEVVLQTYLDQLPQGQRQRYFNLITYSKDAATLPLPLLETLGRSGMTISDPNFLEDLKNAAKIYSVNSLVGQVPQRVNQTQSKQRTGGEVEKRPVPEESSKPGKKLILVSEKPACLTFGGQLSNPTATAQNIAATSTLTALFAPRFESVDTVYLANPDAALTKFVRSLRRAPTAVFLTGQEGAAATTAGRPNASRAIQELYGSSVPTTPTQAYKELASQFYYNPITIGSSKAPLLESSFLDKSGDGFVADRILVVQRNTAGQPPMQFSNKRQSFTLISFITARNSNPVYDTFFRCGDSPENHQWLKFTFASPTQTEPVEVNPKLALEAGSVLLFYKVTSPDMPMGSPAYEPSALFLPPATQKPAVVAAQPKVSSKKMIDITANKRDNTACPTDMLMVLPTGIKIDFDKDRTRTAIGNRKFIGPNGETFRGILEIKKIAGFENFTLTCVDKALAEEAKIIQSYQYPRTDKMGRTLLTQTSWVKQSDAQQAKLIRIKVGLAHDISDFWETYNWFQKVDIDAGASPRAEAKLNQLLTQGTNLLNKFSQQTQLADEQLDIVAAVDDVLENFGGKLVASPQVLVKYNEARSTVQMNELVVPDEVEENRVEAIDDLMQPFHDYVGYTKVLAQYLADDWEYKKFQSFMKLPHTEVEVEQYKVDLRDEKERVTSQILFELVDDSFANMGFPSRGYFLYLDNLNRWSEAGQFPDKFGRLIDDVFRFWDVDVALRLATQLKPISELSRIGTISEESIIPARVKRNISKEDQKAVQQFVASLTPRYPTSDEAPAELAARMNKFKEEFEKVVDLSDVIAENDELFSDEQVTLFNDNMNLEGGRTISQAIEELKEKRRRIGLSDEGDVEEDLKAQYFE